MSTHTIRVELLLNKDEGETPVWITYTYDRGTVEFCSAILSDLAIDDDQPEELQDKAEEWLLGPGFAYACDCAETDLLATRAAHLENSREQ